MKMQLFKAVRCFLVLLCLSICSLGFARSGVGHGGGGEWFVIECLATAKQNQSLSVNVCLTGETNQQGQYEIIPCGEDHSAYVTIRRSTKLSSSSPLIETIKVPSRLFTVDWNEEGFFLKMRDPKVGHLNLIHVDLPDQTRGSILDLNISSMKHYQKGVLCKFASN